MTHDIMRDSPPISQPEGATDGPPCPRQEPRCSGRLVYRDTPERLVCPVCGRVWSLTEIAILGGRR